MSFAFLLICFLAGIMTILASCVLPLVPAITAGALWGVRSLATLLVCSSLFVSLLISTLLFRSFLSPIFVQEKVLFAFTGSLIILLGITWIFPNIWKIWLSKIRFGTVSFSLLQWANQFPAWFKPVMLGVVLAPVFVSCSPVYLFILSQIIPQTLPVGILYLSVYFLGMMTSAFLVMASAGILRIVFTRIKPKNTFRKVLGFLCVLMGVIIFTGYHRHIEQALITHNSYEILDFEKGLLAPFKQEFIKPLQP